MALFMASLYLVALQTILGLKLALKRFPEAQWHLWHASKLRCFLEAELCWQDCASSRRSLSAEIVRMSSVDGQQE